MIGGIGPRYPDKYEYLHIAADDMSEFKLKPFFMKAIEFIDEAIKGGNNVLVHCAAGISRSGCIICAYLMWKNNWTFEEAWEFGKKGRSCMYPNIGFQSQLREFELELKSTDKRPSSS